MRQVGTSRGRHLFVPKLDGLGILELPESPLTNRPPPGIS